jgi:D-sedoheptulose 7-phosphate isomerase
MRYKKRIQEHVSELQSTLFKIDAEKVQALSEKLNETMQNCKAIFVFGNGGCSSLAAHFCADLGKMMLLERNEHYRIFSLNDNIPSMTAWANDTGYENIFGRQLELYMQPGDLVFALSGSGNSPNVIEAVKYARKQNNFVISLAGFNGGKLAENSDICCLVPSHNMQIVEDIYGIILHAIYVTLRDSEAHITVVDESAIERPIPVEL